MNAKTRSLQWEPRYFEVQKYVSFRWVAGGMWTTIGYRRTRAAANKLLGAHEA